MNTHEFAGVLAYLTSGWPAWDVTDDNADVWEHELISLEPGPALEAARTLIRHSTFPPSIAEFLDAYRTVTYHRRIAEAAPALEAGRGELPPGTFAEVRQRLSEWQGINHRYTGPNTDQDWREPVVLPKSRCPRCGELTIPYSQTIEPREIDPVVPYEDA